MKREQPIQAARHIAPIDWRGVPRPLIGKMSAVCHTFAECDDLVAWFGSSDFCPFQPVLLLIPGMQPVAIVGDGYATAAELRDCAVYAWEDHTAKIAKQGKLHDFDTLREKNGLTRREDVDAAVRQAIVDRINAHKASPVTDPFREPDYPRVNEKTVFPQPQGNAWKEANE